MNHLILALCTTHLDVILELANLIYYNLNLHNNLDFKNLLHYHGNLIHYNLKQPQHNLVKHLEVIFNLILRWLRSTNMLALMIAFDFNANDLTNKKLRSSALFDVIEIYINDLINVIYINILIEINLIEINLELEMDLQRTMCNPLTSLEPNVIIYLMDGIAVMKVSSTSTKIQWTTGK